MQIPDTATSSLLDLGFLIARVLIGLLIAAHGTQKLFGWFGGHGLEGTGAFFGQLGFQPSSPYGGGRGGRRGNLGAVHAHLNAETKSLSIIGLLLLMVPSRKSFADGVYFPFHTSRNICFEAFT